MRVRRGRIAAALIGLWSAATLAAVPLVDAAKDGDAAALRQLLNESVDANETDADGASALLWAASRDDVESVRLLIGAGADPRRANAFGVTPLYLAASLGSVRGIELLTEAGADARAVDWTGEPLLMAAVRSGISEAVSALLEAGAEVDARDTTYGQTPLMVAVREGQTAIAALLIERGADVEAVTRTGETPEFRPPGAGGGSHGIGIVRGGWPEQGMRGPVPGAMTPLLYAAREGRLDAARLLVDAGAAVDRTDANGMTPLILALTNANVAVADFLLDHGADVNARDWYGQTPLFVAVDVRNLDVSSSTLTNGVDRAPMLALIERLLASGADANARTEQVPPIRRFMMPLGSLSWVDFTGQTPFLRAALAGDLTVMRLLLEHGADPHITTFGGTTPLMAAAGVNWVFSQTYDEGPDALLAAVELCRELGQDVNAANSMGIRAVHGAANRGSNRIIEYLAAHGADLEAADNEGRTPRVWAEGVFLATHAPEPKPATIALIDRLVESAQR